MAGRDEGERVDPHGVDLWLLPGDLARAVQRKSRRSGSIRLPRAPGIRHVQRTARDWVVDSLVFLGCVAGWAAQAFGLSSAAPVPAWLLQIDVVSGALMCIALWWRRDFPVVVGLTAAAFGAVSNTGAFALTVAFFSLALHRGWRWGYGVAVLAQVLAIPHLVMFVPEGIENSAVWAVIVGLWVLLAATAGLMVRARRQLVWVLVARAEEAKEQQARNVAAARTAERERIAREMHDVLAHRLSLLAVHAGALELRLDQAPGAQVPADALAESVAVVRRSAHQSLEELREVLQVMRGPVHEEDDHADHEWGTAPPAPTLEGLPALVNEAREGGQVVDFETAELTSTAVPASVQRTVYRIVQEGLTNARKHSPGTTVRVRLDAHLRGAAPSLAVRVSNKVPPGVTAAELPSAGTGQLGLAERVAVHAGTFERTVRDGEYVLTARIPLPASPAT
ncbi:sensor histidine kinase [Ruania halotolerans]|uniref:sensor histidine kinase n=1 Tax=Ruania halotolerans TaxID=2897773 RepID=UPI001E342B66|nr:histidine kinase [Ruania halotolerans]UFU07892.1 histidine kinase [Ruania halotolerans]